MRNSLLLIVPASAGVLATASDYLPFKMGVPLLCLAILVWLFWQKLAAQRDILCVIGIGAYFVAHIGYLGFAWRNGRVSRRAFAVLLVAYLTYFIILLTVISFNEFLNYGELNWLIFPTYYLAHLSVTATVLLREQAAEDPVPALV